MIEQQSAPTPADAAASPSRAALRWAKRLRTMMIIFAPAAGPGVLLLSLLHSYHYPRVQAMLLSAAATACAAAFNATILMLLRKIHAWRQSVQRLAAALAEARSGQISIEELGRFDAVMEPIVVQFQSLLRELRQEKAENQRIELELSARVARRTDALERRIGSLQQQATRDPLTGLLNRRVMEDHLLTALDTALNRNQDLCVLMMDLDHFKLLNDTLGHAAGDDLLRSLSQIIRSTLRAEDLAFRCGGDEFVVVLPDTSLIAGQAVADRLMSLADAMGRSYRVSKAVGLSIGLVSLNEVPEATVEKLLQTADQRLYERKKIRKEQRPMRIVS